jgi:hypothetical protein
MLSGETYIIKARSGSLPFDDITGHLDNEPLIGAVPNHDGMWVTAGDRGTLRHRLDNSRRSGRPPYGGALIYMREQFVSLHITGAYVEDAVLLVRFLEWLQTRCDIVITEDGYGTPPELERVGVRAFLPEELRDQVDALYEEAVRREPAPTFEDELDDDEEHEGDPN